MTLEVTSSTQFILITTNANSNTDLRNHPIVIAASINKKPYTRGTNFRENYADYISYESYYSFNEYPFLRIDMSQSSYLGTFPLTLYITFYNYGEYSTPQILFSNLDFQPSAIAYSDSDTTCINSCNSRSSNSNVCTKGVCSCTEGYAGDDCWMLNPVEFTSSLTGASTSFDLTTYDNKVFFVKKKDIYDFRYTTFYFVVGEKYKKEKYSQKIETRWGVNSMVSSSDNIIMINYFYQKNYPKEDGNAVDKIKQSVTAVRKDYFDLNDNDIIYFGFRNIYTETIKGSFQTLERGMPMGLKIMIPVTVIFFPGIIALIFYTFFFCDGEKKSDEGEIEEEEDYEIPKVDKNKIAPVEHYYYKSNGNNMNGYTKNSDMDNSAINHINRDEN